MRRLLPLVLVVAAAALPASAQATVTIDSASITPSTTAAGAHPNVTIDLQFSESPTSDDLKDLETVLPQGLVGNPKAADRCTQSSFQADSCPAGSKIGTTTVEAAATILLVEQQQTSSGDVYNLVPQAGEPARLGVIVRPPPVPGTAKIFLQSGVTIGPQTNYGLATKFTNIPRTSGSVPIRITRQTLTLNGQAAHGAFLTNPTSCSTATMTVTATPYDSGTPSTKTASFTPTNCGALPFQPHLSGSIGARGQTAKGAGTSFVTTITSRPGDANTKSAQVTLPAAVTPNLAHPTCSSDQLAANDCPAGAQVGSARAESPLLDSPATGPVWYVVPSGGGLPQLVVQLGGLVPLTLTGQTTIADNHLANLFDNLPDLPQSRFQLSLSGGSNALLTNAVDLCAGKPDTASTASYTAHSGATHGETVSLAVLGCPPPRPTGSVALRFPSGHGVLTGDFHTVGASSPRLSRLRVTLPNSLSHPRRHPKRLVDASADGKPIGRKAIRIRGKQLQIVFVHGAHRTHFRWRGLRGPVGSRPKFDVELLDFAGRVTALSLKSR